MKHELALAVVVAVGLGTVGVTIAVGRSVGEPTVVGNPYEAGLHHREAVAAGRSAPGSAQRVTPACDVGERPCAKEAGAYDVTLDLAPRPLRTMAELAAAVELRREGSPVEGAEVVLSFDMRGMSMGTNQRTLAPAGGGRYAGKAVLVRCPSGRKDWVATVTVTEGDRPASVARFDFAVAE
jgi:hypothetical protein